MASILVTKLLSKGNASRPSSSQRVSPRLQSSPTSHRSKEHLADQLIRLSGNNPWFCFTKPDSANLPGNDSVLERHPQSRTVLAGNKKLTSRRMLRPLLAILDDLKTHVLAQYSAIGHTTDNLGHRRIGTSVHAVSTIALISECRHIRPCRPAITCNNVSKRIASPIVELYLCARTYPVAVWMSPPDWMPVSFKLVSLRSPFF